MDTRLNSDIGNGVIVLIDDMPMRRAQIMAFLVGWGENLQLQVMARNLPTSELADSPDRTRMIIVSVGGDPLPHSRALSFIARQDRSEHGIPVVVFSDRSAKRDAQIAFQAGAKGYIPSTTEPGLALQALTFILNGGHYFPSMTL